MTKNLKVDIRLSEQEKTIIKNRAKEYGFTSISEYIRIMAIKGNIIIK